MIKHSVFDYMMKYRFVEGNTIGYNNTSLDFLSTGHGRELGGTSLSVLKGQRCSFNLCIVFFSTMVKVKMMSFIVTFCVLIAISEGMGIKAGIVNRIRKKSRQLQKCCAKIKCFLPDICITTSLIPMKCRCKILAKVDKNFML